MTVLEAVKRILDNDWEGVGPMDISTLGHALSMVDIINKSNCDAVCSASLFHYEAIENFKKNKIYNTQNEKEGNFDFINSNKSFERIKPINIIDLKKYLTINNIPLRP